MKTSEKRQNDGKINIVMKNYIIIFIFLGIIVPLNASSFDQGKESFLNNKPAEAIVFFEKAKKEEPQNENVFMYLGLSQIQNGSIDKAISSFLDGADLHGSQKGRFYLNVGNAFFSENNLAKAEEYYNLVIESNLTEKGEALLNRANLFLKKEELDTAADEYEKYLAEVPGSYQKEKILRLISLIRNKLEDEALEAERIAAEEERKRLQEEERKKNEAAEAERSRLADEKRRAEEAARQQALMDEILNSLSNISEDTQNISAGSETISHTDEESDIDD